MVPLTSLWMPVLLSAVLVFVASSVMHMLFTYHQSDYGRLPAEDQVMAALRPFNLAPGDYMAPRAGSAKEMGSPVLQEKLKKGPVFMMTVMPSGPMAMGGTLAQWFVYCCIVGLFVAYVTGRALGVGADYREVFRMASTVAFVGYTLALWQNSIWYKRKWTTTIKSTVDGFVHALLVGGTFGWLWP
jgi:hypothetical protein